MRAATYCRSSKDRADVSLSAQYHELEKLAKTRGLTIVQAARYEDAVESGKTENRPGFLALVRAIKDSQRGWKYLLVYDTSRIARRRYIAQAIKHQAKKSGVIILYARMPADLDPVAELVLESVFEAMDEAHSLMSREKGLAGMAENVRQGWRAGGRAPMGYALQTHATGAVRDGKLVTKSKLVPNEHAKAIGAYLKARAVGVPRCLAMREARIERAENSMIGVEWNALTYAGHTVWNRHAGDDAGTKRRPRSEWHITRDTHPALITEAEAEAILAQLETSPIGEAIRRAKASMSDHLLTGLLYTAEGQMWIGHGHYYRLRDRSGTKRGRLIAADIVDRSVSIQVQADRQSDLYLRKLLEAAKRAKADLDPAAAIAARIRQLDREKAKAAELALTSDAPTFLQLVADKSRQMDALRREAAAVRADDGLSKHLASLTIEGLKELLADQRPQTAIQTLVERVVLEPDLTCRLHYKAVPGKAGWRSVASPRGLEEWPPDLTRLIDLKRVA